MNAIDYAVVAAYLVAITIFGSYFARVPEEHQELLPDRQLDPVVGDLLHDRRDRDEHADVHRRAGVRLRRQLDVPAARRRLRDRPRSSSASLFLPRYFRGALVTSYQLLQRRFGPSVSTVAAGLFLVTRSLADGIRLFATALVISIVTGVPVPWTVCVLGAAMIVYTVRGGSAAVIWTDVVQMFIYIAGALVVFFALLNQIPGGWGEVVAAGIGGGEVHRLRPLARPEEDLHALGRPGRRRRADAGDARHRPVPGAAAAVGRLAEIRRARAGAERVHRLRAVRAVPDDRRDALRLSPARPADRGAAAQRRDPAALHRRSPAARPDRLHRRGDRRRGAVAVDQRDGGDDGQRFLPALRARRRPTKRRCCGCRSGSRSSGASSSCSSRSARSGWISRCSTPGCRCCR